MNEDTIRTQEARDAAGELESGDVGCDGDGFHYDTITVPDGSTYESLGIREWVPD